MKVISFLSVLTVFLNFFSCKAQPVATSSVENKPLDTSTHRINQTDISNFTIDYLMGKFDPSDHPDFILIPAQYRDEEIRYIRKDVLKSFISMYDAAVKEGIYIKIRSATRNFENQKRIWENKWTGKTLLEDKLNAALDIKDDMSRAKKILEYSSMPGTSRHHWGTDMDFNAFENEWFESGEGLKIYSWLSNHGHKYGFCQPYSKMGTDRYAGYFEEKWHWTYMPVSQKLTELAGKALKNEMISGFLGAETAMKIDVVKNYILSISPACKHTRN